MSAERAKEIIATIAKEHRVEDMVHAIAHTDTLAGELSDLCQETYCILLDYPPDKVAAIWDAGEMQYFLSKLITNQLHSKTSRFYYKYKRFQALSTGIDGKDFPDKTPTY